MSELLDNVIYMATAPLRLFGRSRRFRLALGAAMVTGAFFAATLWALDRYFPAGGASRVAAKLKPLPPLPPLTRTSYVIAPVAVALSAIQRNLEAAAPRQLSGKNDNPVSSLLSKATIGITITRGNVAVNGKANELTVLTPINGSLQVAGVISSTAGALTGTITGLIDSTIGKTVGGITTRVLDQKAEVRGQVTVHSKPALTANWRLEPNLTAQVAVGDSAVQLAGIRLNMANEAKPMIERAANEQVAALQARLRNDPFIERAAREQWAKMCRSIPLGGGDTGLPKLWLEMRPVRAAAAQPKIDAHDVTLVIGVTADTRIVAKEAKPDCPFPAALDLVPPMENGKLAIILPVDVPLSEVGKLLNAQLKGHRYPDDNSAAVEAEVRSASIAAADDRLLISLKVNAREQKSWFGFGAAASIDIWGRPALDPQTQMLRLTDISLAVESEAAFGLLGTAARAAIPYLQQALADNAVIDLKPFIADAKKKIDASLADFRQNRDGVAVDADVRDLRLTGIAFDSQNLRLIAEATGTARVAVTQLPKL